MAKWLIVMRYSAAKCVEAETQEEAKDIALGFVEDSDIKYDDWYAEPAQEDLEAVNVVP